VLKELFEPPPGNIWLDIDYKNIELRIWAYAIGNKELIESFEKGVSIHLMIMQTLYPREYEALQDDPDDLRLQRLYRNVKGGNFALIYGATETKADETYGYTGATKKVYSRFPGIQEYTRDLIAECEENKRDLKRFGVHVLGGYFLDVPSNEPFKACNYKTQGAAGNHHHLRNDCCLRTPRFIDSGSTIVLNKSMTPSNLKYLSTKSSKDSRSYCTRYGKLCTRHLRTNTSRLRR
jgi:hypothetical protein